jgi:ActR/RegA family two-component response regulator
MSGMIMGGMIGADNRLREYEARVRVHKRMAIDRATWERYEQAYEEPKKNGAKATKKTKENNNE